MFGKKNKITLTNETPSCSICIYAQYNDDYDLICKGKKEVEPDHKCRRFSLDITKAANQRSHISAKKQFDEDAFKL